MLLIQFLQQRAATHLTVDSSILCARRPSLFEFDSGKTGCQTSLIVGYSPTVRAYSDSIALTARPVAVASDLSALASNDI